MLRIIHTGRAYEVMDAEPILCELRNEYAANEYIALETRYWQQSTELEKTRREVGHLKALLFALEQKLKAAELEPKSCQRKSTFAIYGSQDPR